MSLYLTESVRFEELEWYGFRDAGDCYIWGEVYEGVADDVRGQNLIKIDKADRRVTFVSYGVGAKWDTLERKARQIEKLWERRQSLWVQRSS